MVEGTTLERWHTRKGIEGSNPSLSVLTTNQTNANGTGPSLSGNPTCETSILKLEDRGRMCSVFLNESLYGNRRELMKTAGLGVAAAAILPSLAPSNIPGKTAGESA